MTKIVTLMIGLVLASNASAFPMFCKGNGYSVSINSKGKLAQVYDKNEQPLMFGKLACNDIFTAIFRPEGQPVISCRTIQPVADAGLSVYVYNPHHTDKFLGRLTTQTIAGPRKLADLKCVMALH